MAIVVLAGRDQPDAPPPAALIFEGEIVLQDRPLIVAVPAAMEPGFDTSDLGERIFLKPITSFNDPGVAELLASVDLFFGEENAFADADIRKISLVGQVKFEAVATVVVDGSRSDAFGPQPRGTVRRTRFLVSTNGASGGGGDDVQNDQALAMFHPTETFEGLTQGEGGFDTGVWFPEDDEAPPGPTQLIDVSLDISVVQYIIDGKSVWSVPVTGVAVVPTVAAGNTKVEVVLFNENGDVMYRVRETAAEQR